MARRSGFMRLDGALAKAVERLQLEHVLREGRAITVWSEVVGAQVAEATRAENVRDGVLSVVARSSTWAFELTFHKEKILRGLNTRLGRGTLRDIRFRVGSLEEPEGTPPPEPIPDAAALAGLPLSPESAAAIDAAVAGQPDPELREQLTRTLAAEQRRNQWLAEHGYRPCARCGTLHRRATPECPACRREIRLRGE
jgi:predicted nucleic acid-binding Zn ribbon protein